MRAIIESPAFVESTCSLVYIEDTFINIFVTFLFKNK